MNFKNNMKKDYNLDEFHEWIEKNDWEFNPVVINGEIKYRWVNEACPSQLTTKDLFENFFVDSK